MKYLKKISCLLMLSLFLTGCSTNNSTTDISKPQQDIVSDEFTNEQLNQPITELSDNKVNIYIFDVEQGASCLIESNNEYMLIDGGENHCEELIVNYLNELNVTTLKYVVGTHPDSDHIGGLDAVIDNFNVENVFLSEEKDTKTSDDVITSLLNKGMYYTIPNVGDKFTLGYGEFIVLGPTNFYKSSNDNSIIIKYICDEFEFLTTGDAEQKGEKDLLATTYDLTADVFNAGHHGSSNASSEELLDRVKPQIVTVSVGENKYGHPHQETLDRFEERNIEYYRTDEIGTIQITSDGINFKVNNLTFDAKDENIVEENKNSITDETTPTSETVYKTKTGSKYHKDGCDSLNNSKISILLEDAIEEGLEPCKKCYN